MTSPAEQKGHTAGDNAPPTSPPSYAAPIVINPEFGKLLPPTPINTGLNTALNPPTLDEWIDGLLGTDGAFLRQNRGIVEDLFRRASEIHGLMKKGHSADEAAQIVSQQHRITRIAARHTKSVAHVRNVLRCLQNTAMPESITLGEGATA